MNLFLVPFAGGSEISYNELTSSLSSKGFNCIQCGLPGRGKNISKDLLTSVPKMAEFIFSQIKADILKGEYAIFGHSMGALLSVHVISLISDYNFPLPSVLFLSGRGGQIKPASLPHKSKMDSVSFRKVLKDFGGISKEIIEDDGIMSFFEPIIKSDLASIENYLPIEAFFPKLKVVVFGGYSDEFNEIDMKYWQRISGKKISYKFFNGGHFFIFDNKAELSNTMEYYAKS